MQDIMLDTGFKKFHYVLSWVSILVFGLIVGWLIAIGLYTYGKDTIDNKQKKKELLNMSYQKFIYVWGFIFGYLLLTLLILDLLDIIGII